MTADETARRLDALWVFLATLLGHGLVALSTPQVGTFAKYTSAVAGLRDGSVAPERLLDFSPLYLGLASVASSVAAVGVEASTLLSGLHFLLAALAVSCFFRLVETRLGRRWALAAAALLAFDSHLLVYARILEPESLLLALLLCLLVLLERPGAGSAAVAGVLAALAVATRPTFLPVFFLVPLYFRMQESAPASWRRRGALFLAPVVLCLLLLSWRAHRISGSWTTPVMNPGTVMYEGNQPLSRGTSAVYPPSVTAMVRSGTGQPDAAHEHYRQAARAVEPEADVARVNALWSGRAWAYLADHPGLALRRLRTKLLYTFHGFSWHDVTTAWRLDGLLPMPTLPMSLLSATALLGLAVEVRRWRRALPFYALVAVQLVVMSVFYVSARQRLVLLPALVYFALCALRSLFGRGRSWTVRILAGLLLMVLALPLAVPDDAMLDEAYQRRAFAEAEHRLDELRTSGTPLAAQRRALVDALATAPWSLDQIWPAWVPQDDATLDERVADELEGRLRGDHRANPLGLSPFFDLATVQLEARRLDQAEDLLAMLIEVGFRAYRGGRQTSDPRVLQARVDAARGDAGSALAWLDQVLADDPGNLFALAERAALSDDAAVRDESVRLLDRYVGEADRRWLLGRALLRAGQWRVGRAEEALVQLEPLARSLPQLREVHVYLGLALAEVGRIDAAAESVLRANHIGPEPVLEVRAVADLARRWASAHPDDARVQLLAVRLLHQHGMFRDARRRLDELERLHLSPSDRRQVEEIRIRLREASTSRSRP